LNGYMLSVVLVVCGKQTLCLSVCLFLSLSLYLSISLSLSMYLSVSVEKCSITSITSHYNSGTLYSLARCTCLYKSLSPHVENVSTRRCHKTTDNRDVRLQCLIKVTANITGKCGIFRQLIKH